MSTRQEVLAFKGIEVNGTDEERTAEVKKLLEEYWIILEYNNIKLESNRVLQALEDPINTELIDEGRSASDCQEDDWR